MFDFTLAGAVIAKRSRQRNRGAHALAGNPHVVAIIQNLLLMVIETDIWSSGMPSNSCRMSRMESTATPAMPTSPATRGWSES